MTAARRARWLPGSLLSGLSEETVDSLMAIARLHTAEPGEQIFGEGEPGSHVEVILYGYCKVSVTTAEGYRALLAIRGAGDLIGEMAEFNGQVRSATVTASGTVELAAVAHPAFQTFLRQHADATRQLSRMVGNRLSWANRRRVDGGAYSAEARLARLLLDLTAVCGRPAPPGIRLDVPLSQHELASLVGAAVPTVHRALAAFRRQALVETGYRTITILDPDALSRIR